ncbi:hypothetical protein GCM10028796_18640 [Ramlibacter monticola]|uniref:DoxX family membrane protein n=1 Tax=Ramlibacter monticola TaxID=1926872 RepID=A0A936Z1M7_9BURK|nr:DoxX family membrane protein [Ramlibacter monticola]MBL0392126.1 DoxX family membrane protein [Ramlibacter monticola]
MPESLTALMATPVFVILLLLALAVIGWVCRVDARLAGNNREIMHLQRRIDRRMTQFAAPVLRYGLALFFASVALYFRNEPITLTPELKSPAAWVVPLQLAIAGGLLFRAGVVPACAGMVLLFLYSVHLYGAVHMLDYHLFFGVCVFLALDRFSERQGAATGLLVLRLLVSTSFLWVGIEKWLYAEWTCDILEHQLPVLTMGLDPDFWTMAAGYVEVALAFLMLFGGASSQVAALLLLALMGAAIPLVGLVDAIGHLPMLFALFVLATTRNRLPRRLREHATWQPANLCSVFLLASTGLTGLYYLVHEFAPATNARLAEVWPDALLAALASSALAAWVARTILRNRGAPTVREVR